MCNNQELQQFQIIDDEINLLITPSHGMDSTVESRDRALLTPLSNFPNGTNMRRHSTLAMANMQRNLQGGDDDRLILSILKEQTVRVNNAKEATMLFLPKIRI
jgi:hypothetical protein